MPDDATDLTGDEQLEDLLGQLRAPATAGELHGGEVVVERMARMARPRRTAARMAATAGTALILCAGAAAAATGGALLDPIAGGDSPILAASDDALDDGAPVVGSHTHGVRAQDEVPAEPASIFDDPEIQAACDAAETHGEFVSAVAGDKVEGEHHGTRVSEAAHSTCGKPDKPDKPDKRDKPERPDKPDKPERD